MEKYKVLEDFTNRNVKYKKDEIYYIGKCICDKYGVFNSGDEKSPLFDVLPCKLKYKFQRINDIYEQSKKLQENKSYHYNELCEILNEYNFGRSHEEKSKQVELWRQYFEWEHGKNKSIFNIIKIKNDTTSQINKLNDFIIKTDELKNIAGVYILKFKDDLLYIGQSTNLQRRLLEHKEKYKDFDFEILEIIKNTNDIKSNYITSTALIFLEGKYIDQYGLNNLQNKINTYKECCDVRSDVNIYNFESCTKNITYNLFMKLKSYDNDINLFIESCKDYTLRDICNLEYYHLDMKIEDTKLAISKLYNIHIEECDKYWNDVRNNLNNIFNKEEFKYDRNKR